MYSSSIEKLIKLFSKFPTVGPRTAARFVFYLINSPKEEVKELITAIADLKNKTKLCVFCFGPFEGEGDRCSICGNPTRDKKTICVVEKEMDLEAIEKTGQFKGLYFVLGSAIEERTEKLLKRLKENGITEVILALNPTTEGQNTALWLRRRLEPLKIKITQLGLGLPVGGELEYADEETLSSALKGRR